MTYKITTDFAGTESLATTKTRLESILDFWLGSGSTSSVSTWGDIRTLLNSVAPAAITIADGELASSFRTKLNTLNSTDDVVSNLLFNANEPGVWYDPSDLTTLFQDTAGTTPVTTPGQTVGLMLDKSKGLVLGPELVTNGTFDTDTGWTKGVGWTISGGALNAASASSQTVQFRSFTAGSVYRLDLTVSSFSAGSVTINLGGEASFNVTGSGSISTYLRVPSVSVGAIFITGTGFTGTIDNISVRELPGFHATQPTAAARPTYGIVPETGRRNLLTYTEEFDNGYWLKNGGSSVSPNTIVAPDGTLTADRVSGASGTDFTGAVLRTNSAVFPTSSSNTLSAYLIADGATTVRMYYRDGTTGTVYSTAAIALTASWQRVTLATPTANGGILFWGAADGNFGIWGAQLEEGSTPTAYQKVTTQFDVTEAGVPSLGYLSFDGVDDFMVTPTITPGTDKVQVFAGVRKLSDAAVGMVLEYSASVASNSGSLYLTAPITAGVGNYGWTSKGTVGSAPTAAGFAAPITNVVSGLGDIAGDVSRIRVNGVQIAETTGDQGTGNYLAYPVYIGRRGGSSLSFNGHIYSLITRFGPNLSSDVIGRAETYTAQKTGVAL